MAAPRKDDVKHIIIESTQQLLGQKALADISLAEIARTAGISKGTLYYHYKSKDDILFDITDAYLNKQWEDLVCWTEDENKDTSLPRLMKYVVERNVAASEPRMHLIYAAMLGNEEIRQKLIRRYAEFEALISQKIAERTHTVPPEFFSWLILLASDGLIVQRTLKNENLDIDALIRQGEALLRIMRQGKQSQ